MTFWNILLILALVGLNGFFVSVEFAVVASRRARLELMSSADSASVRLVRSWLEQPAARDRLIAASQLGITLVSLALGAVGENTFQALLEPYFQSILLPAWLGFIKNLIPALPLIISLTVVTSLHVVLGEQVPKVAVLRAPERFALMAAPIMRVFSLIFIWFINLLDWASRMVLSIIGLPATTGITSMYSIEEIKQMVNGPDVEGVIEKQEREMISAVIDFGELVVRQVTTPRTEIVAVQADTSVQEVLQLALDKSITKVPVYETNLDEILGIIHLRDLVRSMQAPEKSAKCARDLAGEVLFVPETISVNELLRELRVRRTHIAIVVDEFGGTYGLVTLEDLLEKIIGDVQGPFETTPPSIQLMPDGSALLDGMTLIEQINDFFGLKLEDPDYDTIAGYVLGKLGRIPDAGDQVEDQDNKVTLSVEKMDRLRIAQVLLSRTQ